MFNKDDAFVVIFKILYYLMYTTKKGLQIEVKYLRHEKLGINENYMCYILNQLEEKKYIIGFVRTFQFVNESEDIKKIIITLDGIEYLESERMQTIKTYLQDKHQLEWWLEETECN
jgi:hypothetical protein